MREHIAPFVYYLEVHILYASILCLAAWAVTSVRSTSATWKYWIWVATSVNFLVPLGGFYNGFGASRVSWATQLGGLDAVGIGISRNLTVGIVLLGAWIGGAALMLARLVAGVHRNRRNESRARRRSSEWLARGFLAQGVPVTVSAAGHGPSVDGVLRPRISLPCGIDRLLSDRELDAVLAHEVTHARRRDNLIGLVHEIAQCVLWFHPLVWLTGFRLAMFRELSCDDYVIEGSRGADLVTALGKLADPGEPRPLHAGAATLFSHRLARLKAPPPQRARGVADLALIVVYVAMFLACVIETIAHTPGCFRVVL